MPMKVLRFEVKREHVGKDAVHAAGYVLGRFGAKIGGVRSGAPRRRRNSLTLDEPLLAIGGYLSEEVGTQA